MTNDEGPVQRPIQLRTEKRVGLIDLDDPSYYVNRELSLLGSSGVCWKKRRMPLTRCWIASFSFPSSARISTSFSWCGSPGRCAKSIPEISEEGPDGMSSIEQLEAIRKGVVSLLAAAQRCFRKQLLPALEANGIHLLEYSQLTPRQQAKADRYFDETVLPVLTPLAFDPGHPFPHISNLSLNLAVLIRDQPRRGAFCAR